MEPVDDSVRDGAPEPGMWPAWATEEIRLAEPDLRWAGLARVRIAEVSDLLAEGGADPAEHVGSTAIPGIPAKPVIDLTTRLPDPPAWCARHAGELTARSWLLVPPELDVVGSDVAGSDRRLLVRVDASGTHRLAHLHVLWPGSPRFAAFVAFRDRLRADPALAAEYVALKRAAEAAHRHDREAYTASKAAFVDRVVSDPAATG